MAQDDRTSRSWKSKVADSVVLPVGMTIGSYLGYALYRRGVGDALDMSDWWAFLPHLVMMGYPLLWAFIWIPWFIGRVRWRDGR